MYKKTRNTRTTHTRTQNRKKARHSSTPHLSFPWQKLPRWVRLAGSIALIVLYVWAFYVYFVGPTGFRWRAIYGDPEYPSGYEIHGIDVSHYQGKIDWDELRNAMVSGCPLRFVIVKATEGSSKLDENFADNFYQAREAGFIRGAYHFWSNKSSARKQANWFLTNVHLEEGDLPPVLDVEHKSPNMSIPDFQREVLTWLHIVEDKYNCKPIIYTNYKFRDQYLSDARFDDYPYWIAHYYVPKMEYHGQWKFWQHTDVGKLPGIRGYVDLNIYNGSFYDLRKLCIQHISNPSDTIPDPIDSLDYLQGNW